jgi:transmembrane sensor
MKSKSFYHFEDFVLDNSFNEYIRGTNEESSEYWEVWIKNHPEALKEVKLAAEVLHTLNNHKKEAAGDSKELALNRLKKSLDQRTPVTIKGRFWKTFSRIAAILILAAGIVYTWKFIIVKNPSDSAVSYNEIIVPVGEKSQIILSDGTHVWINSGSRFKYPVNFGKDRRDVSLEGEAYFDVTHKKIPFIVNTHDAEIKVLGTAFNVKSYPEDLKTQTTVVRGKVKVFSKQEGIRPVVIGPAQMAVIKEPPPGSKLNNKNMRKVTVLNQVNTLVVTSWKDQLLVFADETFEDLSVKMERWFNIKIRIDDKTLRKERYTGKFVNNETVYQVLEAIAVTTPIKYKVQNDEIIITRK